MDVDAHANVIPQTQMQMQMQIEIQPSQLPYCELSKNGNVLITGLFLIFCDIPVICIASFRTTYSVRTIALFFIVVVLVKVYVFCANKFIALERERRFVMALKLRWICAVVLLLISVAYPACLYSLKLPLSCRVIAWTMFAIHFFAAILGNFGYILNNHAQKAIYPVA